MGRRAQGNLLLVVLLITAALGLACGGVRQGAKLSANNSAVLIVKCDISAAEVWINSRYSRSVGEFTRGLRLRPGSYRIEVRHSGYHSRYFEFDLSAKERRTLEVELAQRFP